VLEVIVEIFEYDKKVSYRANYERWRRLNDDERLEFNLDVYPQEESRKVFDQQYTKYRSIHFFW